jgi:hypothetical protein
MRRYVPGVIASMSINCYLYEGNFVDREFDDFELLINSLDLEMLHRQPIDLIVKLLSKFGKELTKSLLHKEGILYLATWLRESNLTKYLSLNLNNKLALDTFIRVEEGLYIRAQPRGVVCHWIAGNIPTLAIFSLIQSILCKNVNILRVPKDCVSGVLEILKILQDISVDYKGKRMTGEEILKATSVVYFPSSDQDLNKKLSLEADCKVIWGGKEAVQSIVPLPQKGHCETVVFGPKYSFAVVDEESIDDSLCNNLAMDIITFDQNACSSPHVIFCEGNGTELTKKYKKTEGNFANILNARGIYWLDPSKDIICSKTLDWTILVNKEVKLEEPIGSRTIFIKEVGDLLETTELITNKIQTIGIAIKNPEKKHDFCEKATFKGVSRCVDIGWMNNYDTPWDGIFFIHRLVRWTSMTNNEFLKKRK